MAYRVELISGLSHTYNGRTVRKSQPQVIDNKDEVAYYQVQQGFRVVNLEGEKPKEDEKPKALSPIAPGKKKAPTQKQKKEPVVYTEDGLKAMKKSVLLSIADGLGILFEGDEKKSRIVRAILKEQDADGDGDELEGGDVE